MSALSPARDMVFGPCMTSTVSYTHLDVYKRQDWLYETQWSRHNPELFCGVSDITRLLEYQLIDP